MDCLKIALHPSEERPTIYASQRVIQKMKINIGFNIIALTHKNCYDMETNLVPMPFK